MSDKAAAQALYDATVAELKERYDLVYIDYRDELSDEDVQNLLNGEVDKVEERLEEYTSENRHRGAEYEVEQLLTDEQRELLEEHDLLYDLQDEIKDRDESDPIRDMLRNTPQKLMTVDLDHEVPDYTLREDDEFEQILADIAEAAGIELAANRDALAEMVGNASYGGRLMVIWYGDAEAAIGATKATWTDPSLLVYNGWNGSGFDGEVKGSVTRDLKAGDIVLDSTRGRYSWEQIAGVHRPAYSCSVDFEKAGR